MRLTGRASGVPLQKRVNVLMAMGILVPAAIMAAVGLRWLEALDDRLLAERASAAGAVAAQLDATMTRELALLQRLAAAVARDFPEASPALVHGAMADARQDLEPRLAVYLLDARGRAVSTLPPGAAQVPAPDAAAVAEVLRDGVPRLSGLDRRGGGWVVHALVPIRRWDGQRVGIAGSTFDPGHRGLAAALAPLRRTGGEADLLGPDGVVLGSTAAERVGLRPACFDAVAAEARGREPTSLGCAGAGDGKVGSRETLTVAPLTVAPWTVVIRQPVGLTSPSGQIPWVVVVGGLALNLAMAALFAWGAARSVTRPLGVLGAEAERIAAGELDAPIPDLGHDEVGRLGLSLDRMREALRQLLRRVGEANQELERRVVERTRALGDANERLRAREDERRQLLRKVIVAQEDERKRVARELHDETTQALALLAMKLDAAREALRAGRTPDLDEVKATAVRTLDDVHRMILDLRPSVLDDLGLTSAVRWYGDRTLGARGVTVRCEFEGPDRRLPPELETAVFRICQEALSNVARHAQASAVLVQVAVGEGEIRVEIEDDGRGFDPDAAVRREGRPAWGLLGIRERAELLGGSAQVDSAPGQGTRVTVRIPVLEVAGPDADSRADAAAPAHEAGAPAQRRAGGGGA
ncbi:MAG: HAMP domain-containing protein [Anaeromyxobacter sp.]